MSIKNNEKRVMAPTHPGAILREDFMQDHNLNVTTLADMLGVSRQTVNELLRERRALSPAMALRLSRLFGKLGLQLCKYALVIYPFGIRAVCLR